MIFAHTSRLMAIALAVIVLPACEQYMDNATCGGPPQIALDDGVFRVDRDMPWVDVCVLGPATLGMVRIADAGELSLGEVTTNNPCISSVFADHQLLQPGGEYHVAIAEWPGYGPPSDVAFLRLVTDDDRVLVHGGVQ